MEIVFLIIGLVIGAAAAWLIAAARQKNSVNDSIAQHPMVAELKQQLRAAADQSLLLQNEKAQLTGQLAAAQQAKSGIEEKLQNQQSEIERIRKEMALEFENMANRLFEEKKKSFTETNKTQMETILQPLKDNLTRFEKQVEKSYDEEKSERIRLKKEIDDLVNLNKKLDEDARNLTTALKGDNKTQGNWGEMILERILERSGLTAGSEYSLQTTATNAEGDRIRPDVIVYLPENKHLIIDSKVSLVAFNSMHAASDDEMRERYLKAHIESLRSHVKLLGEKNYQTSAGWNSPDFVLLFMPIEAAFSSAMQGDPELYNYAWDKQIVIVSPTTLLATMRTVASLWKQEKRTRNAELIADEAGKLYDKFVNFTTDLIDLGKKMDQAKASYSEAMTKLSDGTGNLVSRAEKMKKLGAKATKEMNTALRNRGLESAGEENKDANDTNALA